VPAKDGPKVESYFELTAASDSELIASACSVFEKGPPEEVASRFHVFSLILTVRSPSEQAVRKDPAFMMATIRLGLAASISRLPAAVIIKVKLNAVRTESTAMTNFAVHY
jgi:hypothetical protein